MDSLKFVLGKDKMPVWFNDETARGRAKVNLDDDRKVVSVTIYAPTRTLTAFPGDVIMKLKSGMSVVPKEKAVKYGVVKENKKESN